MKKMSLLSLMLMSSLILVSGELSAMAAKKEVLKLNPAKSSVKWTGTKVTGEHYGKIQFKEGMVKTNAQGEPTQAKFVVDMTSMTVGDLEGKTAKKLVGHLNSDDFFMVNKYKESVLEVSNFKKMSNNKYKATGTLTIKNISKPVSFEMTMNGKTAKANLSVDRTKYNIKYGSGSFFKGLGDKMIHDDFKLNVVVALK